MNTTELAKACRAAAETANADAAEYRKLVLAHPDLAARLTTPPCPSTSPDQWNGYIPPHMVLGKDRWQRNDSPQRVHLVAIVREAYVRKFGEQVARTWLGEINTDQWGADGQWTPHTVTEGNRT